MRHIHICRYSPRIHNQQACTWLFHLHFRDISSHWAALIPTRFHYVELKTHLYYLPLKRQNPDLTCAFYVSRIDPHLHPHLPAGAAQGHEQTRRGSRKLKKNLRFLLSLLHPSHYPLYLHRPLLNCVCILLEKKKRRHTCRRKKIVFYQRIASIHVLQWMQLYSLLTKLLTKEGHSKPNCNIVCYKTC